jgi:hypothetical protein
LIRPASGESIQNEIPLNLPLQRETFIPDLQDRYAFSRLRRKKVRPTGEQPTNSTGDYGSASVMPAWIAGIQVRKGASGDIHVDLGSGTPCRNEETRNIAKVNPFVFLIV